MTDLITPEKARRQADYLRSNEKPWNMNFILHDTARYLDSLAAQLEEADKSLARERLRYHEQKQRAEDAQEALLVAWKYTARAGLSNDQHNELDSIAGVVHAAYDEQVKP